MKFCIKSVFVISALLIVTNSVQAQDTPTAKPSAVEPVITATPVSVPEQDAPVNTNYRADPEWMPKRDPEKGLLIVFRESRFVGGGAKIKLFADGSSLPPVKNGSFMYTYLTPGDHRVYADKKKQRDARILEVEPGEVYFFEASFVMGAWKTTIDLLQTDAEIAKQKMEKLKKPVAKK